MDNACALPGRGWEGTVRRLLTLPEPLAFPAPSPKDSERGLGVGVSVMCAYGEGGVCECRYVTKVWAALSNCVQLAWPQGGRSRAMVLGG